MTNTGHTSKIPRTATGLFALLGAFLHRQGTSAPKTKGSGLTRALEAVASRMPVRGYTTVSALIVGGLYLGALGLPASASAFATLEGPPVYSSAPGLPDGREYVQASPADKNGNEAGANSNSFDTGAGAHYGLVAPDGNSVLFEGTGPMGESPWAHSELFVATKKEKEAGWSTRALLPRAQQRIAGLTAGIGLLHPSQDLSHALLTAGAMTLAPQRNESCRGQLYLTGPDPFEAGTWLEQTGLEHLIENCSDVPGAPAGGTPNFSTVYFTYPGTLLPEDNERASHAGTGDNVEAWGFYEYTEGVLHEAGVLPNGSLDQFGAVPAASGHGTNRVGNQVSENGTRAFFVSPDPASCAGQNNCTVDPPELYVHEKGEERGVLISRDTLLPEVAGLPASAPTGALQMRNPTHANVPFHGSYVFASPDGSQAFFQSDDALTGPAEEVSPGAEPKTYDFDLSTGELAYLPNVTGQIVVTDTDGSSFAFVRPSVKGEQAQLELWSAGPGGGGVTPIVQLPGAPSSGEGEYISDAQMSSDGSALAFVTSTLIAGFNNGGTHPTNNGTTSPGTEQIYRYDAPANTLGCVSCAPPGVTPRGDAWMSVLQGGETTFEPSGEGYTGTVEERAISADGDRIFFDSADPLVPQDTNTNSPEVAYQEEEGFRAQGRDVYEWENGVVYLISTGKSPRDSYLIGSSENGDDVFFSTAEGLVPGDTDGGYDVYDARVPHEGEPLPPAAVPCEGAVCQGPPNVPSPLTPPASATFADLGNPAPEVTPLPPPAKTTTKTVKCKKIYVKNKKNKCIKKHKAKKSAKRSK